MRLKHTIAPLVFWLATGLPGQTVPLTPVVVTALRSEGPDGQSVFSSQLSAGRELREVPALTVDSALRSFPSFGLFRRSDSLTAHPTAQGVSLRGLGPSGASRSLVLLDGIPLNDPFGGWVAWSKVPRESLSQAEIVSGGGAAAWGNAALGGVVQLLSATPGASGGRISAMVGDYETRSAEADISQRVGNDILQFGGRWFESEGYRTVAPEDRGPVDTPAGQSHRWASARWIHSLTEKTEATVTARTFREKRRNGTPYQKNESEEFFVSGALTTREVENLRLSALGYFQDQSFASTFGAVNADRTIETPASDQYDVPARAIGISLTAEWTPSPLSRVIAGIDAREVEGETRELFTYTNGAFTRRRAAGGEQFVTGAYLLHQLDLTKTLSLTAGTRVDYWEEQKGFREETELATGSSIRSEKFPERDGWEWSPTAGLRAKLSDRAYGRVMYQKAFRRPTLNELYRPFRVGNVITEANPALGTETVDTFEVAFGWSAGTLSTEVTAYWNVLRDAVTNVTVARGPGNVPGFGFIPAGGLGRRRENLEEVRVRGLEWTTRWRARDDLSLWLNALLNDTEVIESSQAAALEGNRLAQVPKASVALGMEWKAPGRIRVLPRLRVFGAQFEDDENLLRLAPAAVFDLGVNYELNQVAEIYASIENVFNERIETGRSGAGVINVGQPRFSSGGVRVRW